MNLLALLKTTPEFRHLRGRRHDLDFVLLLVIAGALCGYWGYRPAAEFAQRYGAAICIALGRPVPQRMPSYSTFRRVMVQMDFVAFAAVFNRWAAAYVGIEVAEWMAIDGKSIRGSVTAYNQSAQNFMMLVSVFSHKRGFVLHSQPMENKKIGEQQVVQSIVEVLDLNQAVVSADALHTKKNGSGDSSARRSLSTLRERQSAKALSGTVSLCSSFA